MMKISIKFMPQGQLKQNTKSEIYAEVKYDTFEELKQEFSKTDFPSEARILLEPLDPEGTALEYDHELEYPYGRVTIKLKQAVKTKKDEELQLTDIPPDENEFFMFNIQPKPISMNDLRVEHNKEEAHLAAEDAKAEADKNAANAKAKEEQAVAAEVQAEKLEAEAAHEEAKPPHHHKPHHKPKPPVAAPVAEPVEEMAPPKPAAVSGVPAPAPPAPEPEVEVVAPAPPKPPVAAPAPAPKPPKKTEA